MPITTGLVWRTKLVPRGLASQLEARQTYRRRRWRAGTPPAVPDRMSQGTVNMEDHETRRKLIREWMALPKDQRQTEEQVAAFAKTAAQQNEFHRSRRDPYQKLVGWLLPRAGKS